MGERRRRIQQVVEIVRPAWCGHLGADVGRVRVIVVEAVVGPTVSLWAEASPSAYFMTGSAATSGAESARACRRVNRDLGMAEPYTIGGEIAGAGAAKHRSPARRRRQQRFEQPSEAAGVGAMNRMSHHE